MGPDTRTTWVKTAALMHQRHGVPIPRAALVMGVSVAEVRIELGIDRRVS